MIAGFEPGVVSVIDPPTADISAPDRLRPVFDLYSEIQAGASDRSIVELTITNGQLGGKIATAMGEKPLINRTAALADVVRESCAELVLVREATVEQGYGPDLASRAVAEALMVSLPYVAADSSAAVVVVAP